MYSNNHQKIYIIGFNNQKQYQSNILIYSKKQAKYSLQEYFWYSDQAELNCQNQRFDQDIVRVLSVLSDNRQIKQQIQGQFIVRSISKKQIQMMAYFTIQINKQIVLIRSIREIMKNQKNRDKEDEENKQKKVQKQKTAGKSDELPNQKIEINYQNKGEEIFFNQIYQMVRQFLGEDIKVIQDQIFKAEKEDELKKNLSDKNFVQFIVRLIIKQMSKSTKMHPIQSKQINELKNRLNKNSGGNRSCLQKLFITSQFQAQNRKLFYEILDDPQTIDKYIIQNNFIGPKGKKSQQMKPQINQRKKKMLAAVKLIKIRLRSKELIDRLQVKS